MGGSEGIKNLFNLDGKVALVMGASGALGRAVSLGLAIHGLDIVPCSVEEDALGTLAGEIRDATGRRALPVFCNVTDVEGLDRMVACATEEFGGIDILFAAAGMAHRERLVGIEIDDWQAAMDANVKGMLVCCRAIARRMIGRG